MTVQAAIEARAVSHRTRTGEVAVRDVSLTVGYGELVAIIGSGGSGKTTLLDAMSGRRLPTSGTVVRQPGGPGRSGRPCRFDRQTGYVPDDAAIHPVLPLARALRYTAELRGVPRGNGLAGEALGLAGLAGKAADPAGALNPGERKRAVIAAELMARPAQLYLDEPTAGLDPAEATEMLRLLRRLSDGGITVVFTTSSPLDAARCDKVAVMATGGHLAFFGTPAAAGGYFGADSLDEIYERLAGLGDPATAWSRRFFHFSRTRVSPTPVPTTPRAPGPAVLVPDAAGPHSAGRPGPVFRDEDVPDADAEFGADVGPDADGDAEPGDQAPGRGPLRLVRQLLVLSTRNAEVLARSWLTRALLAGAPVAVLLSFAVLTAAGAFDGAAAGSAWLMLGGFGLGLAYGLSEVREETGALGAERYAGLSATAYVLAKAAVFLPALAVADAIALLVPAASGKLPHGYGPSYVTLLLSSAVALALALLVSVALPASRRAMTAVIAALSVPALLLAGAVLTLLDRPVWPDWVALIAITAFLPVAAIILIDRYVPAAPRSR